jgi:hypothetical protein
MLNDASVDALVEYLCRPSRFDQSRGTALDAFLYANAWRNLANLVKADRRRQRLQERYATEKRGPEDGWPEVEGAPAGLREVLLRSARNGAERAAVALLLDGVTDNRLARRDSLRRRTVRPLAATAREAVQGPNPETRSAHFPPARASLRQGVNGQTPRRYA